MVLSTKGCDVPIELSAARTYVETTVSGFSWLVPRQVPPPQTCVQCATIESVPSMMAVPVQVPVTSASVKAAGAAAAESAGGVSAPPQAIRNGTAHSKRRMVSPMLNAGELGCCRATTISNHG